MIYSFSSSYLLLQAIIVILPSPPPPDAPKRSNAALCTYRLVPALIATFLQLEF
jgi:hypothetical protein